MYYRVNQYTTTNQILYYALVVLTEASLFYVHTKCTHINYTTKHYLSLFIRKQNSMVSDFRLKFYCIFDK